MTAHKRCAFASILVAAILAFAVSAAPANRIRFSNQRIRAIWTSLRVTNTANANVVLCPTTIEGTFHSATIAKVRGALIGYVTRVNVREPECRGGQIRPINESLPWHIRYREYTGMLPFFSGIVIGIIGAQFEVSEIGSGRCILRTELERPFIGTVRVNVVGVATELNPEPATRIPLGGGGFCPFVSAAFSEESDNLTVLEREERIIVTLI